MAVSGEEDEIRKNDSDDIDDSLVNSTVTRRLFYPPDPLIVDRIQLGLLIILFLIGAPINLVSLTKLRGKRSLARTGRLAMLRLHMNISDLMVLFIYVTSSICWQLTYQWRGGDLLCKLVKFLNSTSFQLSSNMIVCVALDRLFTTICGTVFYKRYVNHHPARYVRICVIVSWIVAIGVNVSQFFVWVVVAPFPQTDPQWRQCITVWAASTHFQRLTRLDPESNINFYANAMKPPFQMDQYTYNLFHIVSVFWIPAAAIVISYTVVVFHMYQLSAKRKTSTRRMAKANLAVEDSITQLSNVAAGVEMAPLERRASANGHAVNGAHGQNEKVDETALANECSHTVVVPKSSSKAYLLPVAIHRMRSKTFRMSILLVLAYFICWTPYNVLALWQFFDQAGFRKYAAVDMKFLNVLIVFNSVVNPFLYGTLKCKFPWRLRQSTWD